ncbi:TetR family transcriptional regulator [Salinibacterium amurskyense]|uniref:TetR family transcriptional regulator n=1 Tax=Salinibacterium amurskyense TaxID=205941 RepID=A0A2M9D8T0_9MICO|nr:TetR/AcrR family transcriptional regulator [Salinibacterium amurskyense]PJJ81893.1 TetR family transcriptional regulator [Salinibacterium amurskyense]RLQ81691.1 TetR family transcriptional regulator [Salinibacterium amurskyense]GHD78924.1 TetR family transcriptional regulator [Salinibacterium amurskyense]
MPDTPALGLRDRKRIETRLRIETAAVDIVTAEGLDGATVDMISDRAGISPRTFFNYFESKEDAILGTQDMGEVQRAIAAGVASAETDDLVAAIVSTMFQIFGPMAARTQLKAQRMALVQEHPRLLSRQIHQFTQLNSTMAAAVVEFLNKRETTLPRDPEHVAEIAVATCVASVRIAVKEWIADGATADIDSMYLRSIGLTRETLNTLQ